ncbi:hypothetical protein, unknown function [Leishmania tarentolae]|uniref:CRAL-TRIO domain-containing protein n=1 Tax=Leishmania tarentolae TaxID=5689 RepID=A0A640KPM9_LEITA|nr:hypothetical protein, unknown function [Leishmania tarentolae]
MTVTRKKTRPTYPAGPTTRSCPRSPCRHAYAPPLLAEAADAFAFGRFYFGLKLHLLVAKRFGVGALPCSPLPQRFGASFETIMSAEVSEPRHRRYVDMTPEREQKITQLVQLMKETYDPLPKQLQILLRYSPTSEDAPTPHNTTRCYCYCALISSRWDVQKSLEGMKKNVAYRMQYHLDERSELPSAASIRGWDERDVVQALGKEARPGNARVDEILAKVDRYLPSGFHYWDRYGQPILYMMLGSVDEGRLLKELKKAANAGESMDALAWVILQHVVGSGEWLAYYQQMQYDAGELTVDASEGLIRAATFVVDLQGFTYKMLWKPAIDLFISCLRKLFEYYPYCVHRILVVNAPSIVNFAYGIIRHVLPEAVQAKIRMAKQHESLPLLREHIEEHYIPDFYGGACHCQGGCVRSYRPKDTTNGTPTADQDNTPNAME